MTVKNETGKEALARSMTVLETAHRVHEALNDRAQMAAGITLNQALVLSEIEARKGRATVSELAALLGRAVHTLTSAVNGLERKGMVQRQTIKGEDRRIIRISITEAGRDAVVAFRFAVVEVVAVVKAGPFDNEPSDAVKHSVEAMVRLLSPGA